MNPLYTYLHELQTIRSTGLAGKETSFPLRLSGMPGRMAPGPFL